MIIFPETKRMRKSRVIKQDITAIATVNYDLLEITGENRACKKIGAFYSALFQKFSSWENKSFDKFARDRYESDTNPRKRFRYTPVDLIYSMERSFYDNGFMKIEVHITISQKNNIISEKNLVHLWNLKNGTLHLQRKKRQH